MSQQDRMDAYFKRVIDIIMKHGWMIQGVFSPDGGHGFLYTAGLSWKGLPEIIIFGLPADDGATILNDLAQQAVDGKVKLEHGAILDGLAVGGYKAILIDVKDDTEYPLSMAHQMHRINQLRLTGDLDQTLKAKAVQLIFQDPDHRWPWDAGYQQSNLPILGDLPYDPHGGQKHRDYEEN